MDGAALPAVSSIAGGILTNRTLDNATENQPVEPFGSLLKKLSSIVQHAEQDEDYDTARERLKRWKNLAVESISTEISSEEGSNLREIWDGYSRVDSENPLGPIMEEATAYASFLVALEESYVAHPQLYKRSSQAALPPRRSLDKGRVFIGHGRSHVWKDLKDFLANRLHLEWDEFNRESAAGKTSVERLGEMLAEASFAFLVLPLRFRPTPTSSGLGRRKR